ncbi:uncharacterized protein K452DRAFT_325132 [Aplosporella prunicola CBS 121167]|uniref:WLM domain-containing protein n=1 Tax=Aplosporella prunicola CBS 121167 TaxID=1176127 RepID=A0A6A6BMV0_9PEZI|nr:uncharacterized protein K452DRAFT_325132 [Aplosporella prunicola CBS 121167]KAF2144594.1 hypothetical protein K452DRAFT_325132 [Aplosporella prunicola CBS 121167]
MPLGFERLNERTSRPNALINFIKPLPGRTQDVAQHILNLVAARCFPIMKANNIAVMSLEEYSPNPEFVGRNFNAGEVIQLVLKNRDGRWLSIKQVEMVMMHELAHCKEMNHSRFFWRVRDDYAADLCKLWAKGYKGEGLWGRGRELEGGHVVNEDQAVDIGDVEHLCGGTYRKRGHKRKRTKGAEDKKQESWAEKNQRRILRKFGAGGTALGADEDAKTQLEGGKKAKGKPRVANSARGRELRAAAALARFDTKQPEDEEESESGSDYEDDGVDGPIAKDVDGQELRDGNGNNLVRIEDEEGSQTTPARNELRELRQQKITNFIRRQSSSPPNDAPSSANRTASSSAPLRRKASSTTAGSAKSTTSSKRTKTAPSSAVVAAELTCAACSLRNDANALTCIACANVLKPTHLKGHEWRCQSLACQGGVYVNAASCGVCGVCGAKRPKR